MLHSAPPLGMPDPIDESAAHFFAKGNNHRSELDTLPAGAPRDSLTNSMALRFLLVNGFCQR
jgi:hypothetical protein